MSTGRAQLRRSRAWQNGRSLYVKLVCACEWDRVQSGGKIYGTTVTCSKLTTLWTPPEQKSRVSLFPSSQNLLRAGHVPVECISFQARTMAAAVSRASSQPARRDALTLVASPPRLPDLLSNSRSGDSADRQVACDSKPWQRRLGRPSNSLRAPARRW